MTTTSFLQTVFPFLAAIIVGCVIALVGLWANRRLGLDSAKDRLIETYERQMEAYEARIKELERLASERVDRIRYLEQRVTDLEREVRLLLRKGDRDAGV